jgi:isopentenyl phosphate kinase
MENLQFLKLGGSLITDKSLPHTPRLEVLSRLAYEIAAARRSNLAMKLLVGHGSGSFGHVPAQRYNTRQGVRTPEEWQGFVEVWKEASALNHIVVEALHAAGLPAIALPASASLVAKDGKASAWNLMPLTSALQAGLVPVIYGDVIFDQMRGGTIFSTEDLFRFLAPQLGPQRLLLAGLEEGVWADFPRRTQFVEYITPQNVQSVAQALGGSASVDVTGGMESKVRQMMNLVEEIPGLEVLIFSGEKPGNVIQALCGAQIGTRIARSLQPSE